MKLLSIKPKSQQPDNQSVSIDVAKQIAQEAARIASEEAASKVQESRETMENYERFRNPNVQNVQSTQDTQRSSEEDERDYVSSNADSSGYIIDSKTEKNLVKTLLNRTLERALEPPPPSPMETAINNVTSQIGAKVTENMLGILAGGGQPAKNSTMLGEILNSAFGHGLGESMGTSLPQLIQSLTGAIGQKKTQELVDNINSKMSGSSGSSGLSGSSVNENVSSESSNVEKQKNMVLALDSNNPEHILQYATAMGLSQKAAKGILQAHQDDIIEERKSLSGNMSNSSSSNEITQALTVLIQEMTGMKQTISSLQNEIVSIKGKKPGSGVDNVEVDTDSKWDEESELPPHPISVTNKSVTLFQTPIKVDLDEIKGDTNSFFNDTPIENIQEEDVDKESVLEEVKDSNGKSTFKMSSETEHPKEQPKTVPEKFIETGQDKKKETNSVDLNVDASKVEENLTKKRIIRKLVDIKKDVPSHVTERYDIDNNLIK